MYDHYQLPLQVKIVDGHAKKIADYKPKHFSRYDIGLPKAHTSGKKLPIDVTVLHIFVHGEQRNLI